MFDRILKVPWVLKDFEGALGFDRILKVHGCICKGYAEFLMPDYGSIRFMTEYE